jgi:hypothetical protein
MKKSQLKQILKPLVSECIKESLMEDGLISGIIAEVVKGMSPSEITPAVKKPAVDPELDRMKRNAFSNEQANKLQEHRSQLMNSIGSSAYNGIDLFEGTTPAPADGSPLQQRNPLSGQASHDPGVDISSLFGATRRSWTAHMASVKEGK